MAVAPPEEGLLPSLCFVGPGNLPALAREYGHLRVGGMEMQQVLLARTLAKEGYDVSMVVADHGQPDGASWDGITTWRTYARDAGLPIVRFIHPRWTSVWSALKRADADIYYVSGAGMLLGLVALFARRYHRKLVFRVASTLDCDPATLCVEHLRDRKLYEYGLRHADVVLAQTGEQQAMLKRAYGRECTVAPPLAHAGGSGRDFDERDVDVFWVGNLRPLKRPQLFVDLARRLPTLRFAMAGGPYPGAEAFFEEIRRTAASIPNLHFHGWVAPDELHTLYARARVLAGTSETEGFPNIYLQAWSHGMPVVAYLDPDALIRTHGLGEVVAGPDEMAAAVRSLIVSRDLWSAVSARSRHYAAARLDERALLAPYIETFAALAAASAPHRAAREANRFAFNHRGP